VGIELICLRLVGVEPTVGTPFQLGFQNGNHCIRAFIIPSHPWRERGCYAFATVTIYPDVVYVAPDLFETCLATALNDERVRMNLADLMGQ